MYCENHWNERIEIRSPFDSRLNYYRHLSRHLVTVGSRGRLFYSRLVSANVSPLNLTLDVKDGASAASVDALKLTFVMSSPDASGNPLTKDDYVQAKLRLTLPEGITVDLENI